MYIYIPRNSYFRVWNWDILPSASRAETLIFFFSPAGLLSAWIKYVLTKKYTRQPLVFCLNQFSNINNFASNKDILNILKPTESMVPVILDRWLLNIVGHTHYISSMSEDRCFSRSLIFVYCQTIFRSFNEGATCLRQNGYFLLDSHIFG